MKKLLSLMAMLLFSAACFATTITYDAVLKGTSEVPPNASPGHGFATVIVDTTANTMQVEVSFSDLTAPTTASHIHCCTASPGTGNAGVATTAPTFPGFPLGVTSGTYNNTLDLTSASSYNPTFVTAHGGTVSSAEAALLAGIAAGDAYLNIHTTNFPSGEIRGFLTPAPEPASITLLAVALSGWAVRRKRMK